MITINKNILFAIVAILSILTAVGIYVNEGNYLLSFFIFFYLITIPGSLILLSLKIKSLSALKFSLLSVGLSLFFLMSFGLLFNWTLPLFSPSPPLQKALLTIFYGAVISILLMIAYFRNSKFIWSLDIHPLTLIKNVYFLIPPLFASLSVLAVILLNNTGNNILAICTLSGIAIALFITIIFSQRVNKHFFPWSLYFYSLSLLLLLSLRSWYVSGWDIQNEFAVFQLTKNLQLWSPDNLRDAYNACLSITLLPTVFAKLTAFPDDFVYKLFYQILFAFTPVIIYQTYKRYATSLIAFIAVVYIISQPLFIQPMTALMRQEIAFIFFALMLYVLFDPKFSTKIRNVLFVTFGFGMVLSHYSTTYVALILLLTTYSGVSLFRLFSKIKFIATLLQKIKFTTKNTHYLYQLTPLSLILIFSFTFFWYGPVNNQLGKVQKVATDGLVSMHDLFSSEVKSYESKKAITFLEGDYTTLEDIQAYSKQQLEKLGGDKDRLYPYSSYASTNVYPMTPVYIKPTVDTSINRYIFITFEILKQIFKVCVILAPVYLFIRYFRKDTFPREYIVLAGVGVFIIVIMTFHPSLGLQYNLSRFYLQLLFYLSLPAILLILFILSPLKKYAKYVAGSFIILLFIYLLGIPYQFLGGEARMYFNNFGADYDKFYVHKEELASATWLKDNVGNKALLFADHESNLRIFRIINRGMNFDILPSLIYKDAYVYGSYANTISGHTSIYNNGSNLLFSFPNSFLKENKNVIYNNGSSKIYK